MAADASASPSSRRRHGNARGGETPGELREAAADFHRTARSDGLMPMVDEVFRHGVASGDPFPDSVVLWTRLSVDHDGDVELRWELALDPEFATVVAKGTTVARACADHTARAVPQGLEPGRSYFYRFAQAERHSPTGRTRTAPAGRVNSLRLGLVACASLPAGHFNAYRLLAERDVDAVVHVGDYIYELQESLVAGRMHRPSGAASTLAAYRARYAQYRSDPDLQLLHHRHPMVAVWDDHEVADGAWRHGAAGHDPTIQGPWEDRRRAALQAYVEWMPIRLPAPEDPQRIHRRLAFGDLVDLVMLDTRHAGRSKPEGGDGRPEPLIDDSDRELLGGEQRAWMRQVLADSSARWRLVGNQVMMATLRVVDLPERLERLARGRGMVAGGVVVNPGQWDGYPHERRGLLEFLDVHDIHDVVVLTGDIHSSWAAELRLDDDEPSSNVCVEFVTPSVTAPSFARIKIPRLPGAITIARRLLSWQNRHARFIDLAGHGYVVVDVDRDRVQAQWWHVDTVEEKSDRERLAATWEVRHGEPSLQPVLAGGSSRAGRPARLLTSGRSRR